MTAHATIEERQRCLAAGMNDHIAKPIDPANLFETVARFYKPAEVDRACPFSDRAARPDPRCRTGRPVLPTCRRSPASTRRTDCRASAVIASST